MWDHSYSLLWLLIVGEKEVVTINAPWNPVSDVWPSLTTLVRTPYTTDRLYRKYLNSVVNFDCTSSERRHTPPLPEYVPTRRWCGVGVGNVIVPGGFFFFGFVLLSLDYTFTSVETNRSHTSSTLLTDRPGKSYRTSEFNWSLGITVWWMWTVRCVSIYRLERGLGSTIPQRPFDRASRRTV